MYYAPMRAGREPAEDVKKRMVTACKEAGLTVQSAWMRLQKEYGYRLIRADAITLGGLCRKSVIGLSAAVVMLLVFVASRIWATLPLAS